jgi:hypothetical protein
MEITLTGRRCPRTGRLVTAARAGSASIATVAAVTTLAVLPAVPVTASAARADAGYASIDCNSPDSIYYHLKPNISELCADPVRIHDGIYSRFTDDGAYVGHDEPQVRFISSAPGSGHEMTYFVRLPADPARAPTAAGSVTDSLELGVPWFGLELCDPLSYPQHSCIPDSDRNRGGTRPTAAGSALMELQFYAPGFPPFVDGQSCGLRWWCAALTIDSLECSFNMTYCNPNCTEILNFAFLQTNGVPTGPPSPEAAAVSTFIPNAHTLRMYPGDLLRISLADPPRGFTASVTDRSTGTTGYMTASAASGFTDTRIRNCSARRWTYHAEYNTARSQNVLPWEANNGGVVMTWEIGHFDSCASVIHKVPLSAPPGYQTCVGGSEGPGRIGPGPCSQVFFGICKNPETEGSRGPVACPTRRNNGRTRCEFTDAPCFKRGRFGFTINGRKFTQIVPVSDCISADLDFDGLNYQSRTWPDGTSSHPQPLAMIGPFSRGAPYPAIQFETDVGGYERLCHIPSGVNCQAPPLGARFYPYWMLDDLASIAGTHPARHLCAWSFGTVVRGVTLAAFGGDRQYGKPDHRRFAGTLVGRIQPNRAIRGTCAPGSKT